MLHWIWKQPFLFQAFVSEFPDNGSNLDFWVWCNSVLLEKLGDSFSLLFHSCKCLLPCIRYHWSFQQATMVFCTRSLSGALFIPCVPSRLETRDSVTPPLKEVCWATCAGKTQQCIVISSCWAHNIQGKFLWPTQMTPCFQILYSVIW